ncbi:MAG TPA: oligosaccharide flippase family protein [Pyrinomonadaceae bacterium]|nr:oligosaccharide flippase family protein [Pyrinomonadaceae bacterium]
MLVHLRRLSSQTLIYGLGDAVTRVAALILLPIYTRFLTPDDYGKFAIATLFATVLALILDFGQRTAFFRFYFDTDDPIARRKLTGTVLLFLLLASTAVLIPLTLSFNRLGPLLVRDASLVPLIQISLISTFFDVGSAIPFAIFRARQYAAKYAALSLARFTINVTLNIIAIVVLHLGVVGLVYANLGTSALFFLICLVLTVRDIEWTIEPTLLKQLLRFGLPLIPAGLAYWILNLSDRFFLQRYADLTQVGLYSVSYSIAAVLHMVIGWFNTAYAPYCYSIAKEPGATTIYARVMVYSIALLTLLGLGLSLFAREALALLTPPSYHAAAPIVPLIVLSYLFFEVYYIVSFGFDLTRKTGYAPFIIGTSALINLGLNVVLIPRYGMYGAAVATLVSYMLLPVIEYPIVRRLYPVPYAWGRLAKLFIISCLVYLAGAWLKTGRILIDLGSGLSLILVWGLALYLARFFTPPELSAARAAAQRLTTLFRKGLPPPTIESVVSGEKPDKG